MSGHGSLRQISRRPVVRCRRRTTWDGAVLMAWTWPCWSTTPVWRTLDPSDYSTCQPAIPIRSPKATCAEILSNAMCWLQWPCVGSLCRWWWTPWSAIRTSMSTTTGRTTRIRFRCRWRQVPCPMITIYSATKVLYIPTHINYYIISFVINKWIHWRKLKILEKKRT